MFVQVKLLISKEENKKIINASDRKDRFNQLQISGNYNNLSLLKIEHPNLLELEVTNLLALQVRVKIIEHINKLQ